MSSDLNIIISFICLFPLSPIMSGRRIYLVFATLSRKDAILLASLFYWLFIHKNIIFI